ncbi:MAG: DinB family protein [Chloroflexota bacterium]
MKITPAEITKYLAMLEAIPLTVASRTAGLSEDQLRWSPGKKDWSIVEVLAHLRACTEIWSFSIYAMLAEDKPVFPLLDERRWAKAARYASFTFQSAFQIFCLQRQELMAVLKPLEIETWARSATIEGRNHTVFSQARRMALHETEHLHQIRDLLDGLQESGSNR